MELEKQKIIEKNWKKLFYYMTKKYENWFIINFILKYKIKLQAYIKG